MVIQTRHCSRQRGLLITEMMVAMAILVIALLPIAYAAGSDARRFRATYQRAVAMEIVDGEIEILAAGAGRELPEGAHPWTVHAAAAANLPPGRFQYLRTGNHLRLEWSSTAKRGIGPVVREVTLK